MSPPAVALSLSREQQITSEARGHILTNTAVWSPDSRWIVYDTRPDAAGEMFAGTTIERVNVETGEVQSLYRSANGACVGVATCSPVEDKVVFIQGPEHPAVEWSYAACHRQGVVLDLARQRGVTNLDARDLTPPFTPGALRGGTHLHVFSGDGQWVNFTYEDHLLAQFQDTTAGQDLNQRNVGVSAPSGPVRVKKSHPRNHDGDLFSVLVTRTTAHPPAGSDEIQRACEEAWIGVNGYVKPDGARQKRALAFQGEVVTGQGRGIAEVFVVDLPDDVTVPGDGPIEGTATCRPLPPRGVVQRRLTRTALRKFPGVQGPRHWLRSSPDGSRIAFLMKDDEGVAQLWTVSPNGGEPTRVTHNPWGIASAFSWSPDGKQIAHVMDHSVCLTDMATGSTRRLTPRSDAALAPRPEACVFSPDGSKIAFVRAVPAGAKVFNQIFVCHGPEYAH